MGPKKAKSKMPVDGVDTTSMSREQLEAFCIRLREELDREREERNFFQLERDKLCTFWEITRQQLEESRAQQRNQDRAIDELEEKHQAEIKVYKQKVKHLLYEHQCNLSELQVESMVSLKQAQDEYNAMEQQLLKDKKELKEQIHDMELKHLEEVRQLKIDHSAEVSRIREQLESDAAELEKKYEARLTNQAEEQAMREKMEQAELETRKNQHIVELTKQHEAAFQEMKNYYNDITLNNLALISSLKEQMEELKANHDRMEKQLSACQAENKKLAEPFKQAQSELGLLRRQLATYEQDKVTLANTKQRLSLVTKELEDLRWENDVLELRFEKVEKERDRLHAEFVGAVLDVQQKTGLKGALLEKRMASMRSGVSQKSGVSGCSTEFDIARQSSPCKNTRPASAPLLNTSSSSADRETVSRRRALVSSSRPLSRRLFRLVSKSFDDDIASKRSECGSVQTGRNRIKRPQTWEHSKARWAKAIMCPSVQTATVGNAREAAVTPRKRRSEVLSQLCNPTDRQTKDCWWVTPDLPNKSEDVPASTLCICGQHANGYRVNKFDSVTPSIESFNLTFNYLARNHTKKHRYYPQILDCVRRSLSPIHSQEHPSDASIHDGSDKAATPHQMSFSQEDRRSEVTSQTDPEVQKIGFLRPSSASRSDGRDSTSTKSKWQSFSRANTATSLVFRKLTPLPPRPNLPWLHGVKSRYFSSACCHGRPFTVDIQIQTSPTDAKKEVREENAGEILPDFPPETKLNSDDQTQCYFLNNPLDLSYAVGQMDRNYAAVVTIPQSEDPKVPNAMSKSVERTPTGNFACGGYPVSWRTNDRPPSTDRHTARNNPTTLDMPLSVSPLRLIDIDGEDSSVDTSSPAIQTPANASHEDTGAGSLSGLSQVDVTKSSDPKEKSSIDLSQVDVTKSSDPKKKSSIDVGNSLGQPVRQWSLTRDNSVERKHERVPLKRKLKASFLRRLKLKLMICSYMHRHDEEGDVNFVHPSARKISVRPGLHLSQDTLGYEIAEGSLESGDIVYKDPPYESSEGKTLSATHDEKEVGDQNILDSCSRDERPIYQYFCCVCQNELTSAWNPSNDTQICCDDCQKKADTLFGEYECSRSEAETFKKDFDDSSVSEVLSRAKLICESLKKDFDGRSTNAEIERVFSENFVALSDDLSSNTGADLFSRLRLGDDSFDIDDQTSNVGAECILSVGRLADGEFTVSTDQSLKERTDIPNAERVGDSFKTDFDSQSNAARLVCDGFSAESDHVLNAEHDGVVERRFLRESSSGGGASGEALFTLSGVQTAIRSAMKMIKPGKSPRRSPVPTPRAKTQAITVPGSHDVCSRPMTSSVVSFKPRETNPPASTVQSVRFSSAPSTPVAQQHTPELNPPSVLQYEDKDETFLHPTTNVDDDQNFDLTYSKGKIIKETNEKICSRTSAKSFYVCPMTVPQGTLRGNPKKLVYTKFPVQTYNFSANKMACVSKPKNMLVFYEVSKIKSKRDVVRTKKPSDTAVKDDLPHLSRVETRSPTSSHFLLRPQSSVLVSGDAAVVDIHKNAVNIPQEDHMRSVGTTANVSNSHRNNEKFSDQRRVSDTNHCDGRFDLLMRRRRESWILSERSSPLKGDRFADSGKLRHGQEKKAKEDDVRLPRPRQNPQTASIQDKGCQCLQRGRKCNCSLTNHLHIRSLNRPLTEMSTLDISERLLSSCDLAQGPDTDAGKKFGEGVKKKVLRKSKETWPEGANLFSRQHSLRRLGRPEKFVDVYGRLLETMPSLTEESPSVDSSEDASPQVYGSANVRSEKCPDKECVLGRVHPVVPSPPPPSPNVSPASPSTALRRYEFQRRQTFKVSSREARSFEVEGESGQSLPPLPPRGRPPS